MCVCVCVCVWISEAVRDWRWVTVAESAVELVSSLADAAGGGGVASGQVLYERVRTDRASAARSVVGSRRVGQVCNSANKQRVESEMQGLNWGGGRSH